MATKKAVKKAKKPLKPVLKKKAKPMVKKKAKPMVKKKAKPAAGKSERFVCSTCGLVVTVDPACSCDYVHEFVCCEKLMKKK